jgi:hypothetical protein
MRAFMMSEKNSRGPLHRELRGTRAGPALTDRTGHDVANVVVTTGRVINNIPAASGLLFKANELHHKPVQI